MFDSLRLRPIYNLRIPVQQSTVDQIPRVGVHGVAGNMNSIINFLVMLAAVACIVSANFEFEREDTTYLESSDRNDLDYPVDNSIDEIWVSDDNKHDQTQYADATKDGIYYKVYPKKAKTHNKKYPVNDKADDDYAAKEATRSDNVEHTASDSEDTTEGTHSVFLSFILSLFRFPTLLFA